MEIKDQLKQMTEGMLGVVNGLKGMAEKALADLEKRNPEKAAEIKKQMASHDLKAKVEEFAKEAAGLQSFFTGDKPKQ